MSETGLLLARSTMFLRKIWMFALAVWAVSIISYADAWDAPSTVGREFVFALPSDYVYLRNPSQKLYLMSQAGRDVTVTIAASGSKFRDQVTVPANREVVVELPRSLTSRGTGLKQNAVGVRADGDVSVHVQMESGVNSGAFTSIPSKSLGREYIIGIYEPLRPRYQAGFTVTATERGALLKITFSNPVLFGHVFYGPKRVFTFHLDPYESFQVMSDKDLTGTRVVSNHPVAVVAGSECSRVPRGVKYCDYLVEQLPPIHTLGKEFIVAPFRNRRSSYLLRLVAPFNNTVVHFSSETRDAVHLEAGQFYELNYNRHTALAFRSTQPILVLQYSKGYRASRDFVGDPSMVVIPPVEQYVTGSTTLVSMDQDHVTLIVAGANNSQGLSGVRLNGVPIGADLQEWSVLSEGVSVGIYHGTLASGRHTISHADPRAKFLIVGYGTGYISSRAYPVAYNLRRLYVPSGVPLSLPPLGYHVECRSTSMVVTLDTSVFLIDNPDDVMLNDNDCRPDIDQDMDDGIIVIRTDFDSCGTIVQEYMTTVTFSNTLWFSESTITPVSPLRDLPFKCVINQQNASIGVAPSMDELGVIGGSGGIIQPDDAILSDAILDDLSVSLVQFMDDTFAVRRQPEDLTRNGTVALDADVAAAADDDALGDGGALWGEIVEGTRGTETSFFAVNVTSSIDTGVFVDSCWTTPGPDQLDPNNKDIIQNGCGVDDTIRIGASVDDPRFRPIAVDSFSPIGEYHEVFMHCRVQVCRGADASAECAQECPSGSRKRRDSGKTRRDLRVVSTGPIRTT